MIYLFFSDDRTYNKVLYFFFSSRRRHTRSKRDWSSDVCSSDLQYVPVPVQVGDKTVLVGVGVAQWQVPPELNAIMLTLEREKRLLDEKAALGETNNENASSNLTNA